MTVPGIGFVSAATIVSEIIDIGRFKNFDHFASFVGIVPKVYSSGDKDRGKGKFNKEPSKVSAYHDRTAV